MRTKKFRTRFVQACFWYWSGIAAWYLFGEVSTPPDYGLQRYYRIGGALLAIAALLRATRLRVEVDEDGLALCNYFSTRRVEWSEISDVTAGYFGLDISLVNGKRWTATGVTRPDVPWRTKADRVAEYLRCEAVRRRE